MGLTATRTALEDDGDGKRDQHQAEGPAHHVPHRRQCAGGRRTQEVPTEGDTDERQRRQRPDGDSEYQAPPVLLYRGPVELHAVEAVEATLDLAEGGGAGDDRPDEP